MTLSLVRRRWSGLMNIVWARHRAVIRSKIPKQLGMKATLRLFKRVTNRTVIKGKHEVKRRQSNQIAKNLHRKRRKSTKTTT